MALPQPKIDTLEARLGALTMPADGWPRAAREAALERLRAMGLPGARDEYWKFTRPDTLTAPEAPEAALFDAGEPPMFDAFDRLKIVFTDGVFDPAASDDLALEGIEIARLEEAGAADLHWARDVYGTLEARGHAPVPRPLAALNTAYATDGVLIRVTATPSKPVSLIYRQASTTSDAYLHHCIKVETGASLTLLENGPAAARFNNVIEADIADGATLHHVRAQGRDHERRAATHIFARLGEASVFKSFSVTVNGVMTRNETVVEMAGERGVAGEAVAVDARLALADRHQRQMCQRREVAARAEAPLLRNGRVDPLVEHRDEQVDRTLADPRVPLEKGVEPGDEHCAHLLGRQLPSGPGGVAPEQVALELPDVVLGYPLPDEFPEPRVDAVDRLAGLDHVLDSGA